MDVLIVSHIVVHTPATLIQPQRASWDSGMRWTVGLEPSTVGRLGHIQDVPGIPRTLGWDGQWDCSHLEWDSRDSGMGWTVGLQPSRVGFPGLWDGMDSGIAAI